MTPQDMAKVYAIAKKSRRWAENAAPRHHYDPDLCGMCAISTGHLHRALRRAGFRSAVACGPYHCFVLLNGYVIDITSTQFEGYRNRKILIRPLMKLRNTPSHDSAGNNWIIDKVFASRRGARRFQLEEGWPATETTATPAVAGA